MNNDVRKIWVRVRVTLRLAVYRESVRLGPKPLETHDQRFFFNWILAVVVLICITSSLTRGWVCRLQFLLVLARTVILGSEFRGTHGHILLSQIRDSPTWGATFPYVYSPGRWWPSYTPDHCFLFSSPPTTRRATVEVFEPASTRGTLGFEVLTAVVTKCSIFWDITPRSRLKVNLRFGGTWEDVEGCGRMWKEPVIAWRTIPASVWRHWRNQRRILFRIRDVQAEIRAGRIPVQVRNFIAWIKLLGERETNRLFRLWSNAS
jgi:hypothetical protein